MDIPASMSRRLRSRDERLVHPAGAAVMTPAEITKARAEYKELVDRSNSMEIVAAAFRIAKRGYYGPPDSLLLGCSDDHTGCLLRRAAGRGDAEALALLSKVPSIHVTVASSKEMAAAAAGGVVQRRGGRARQALPARRPARAWRPHLGRDDEGDHQQIPCGRARGSAQRRPWPSGSYAHGVGARHPGAWLHRPRRRQDRHLRH